MESSSGTPHLRSAGAIQFEIPANGAFIDEEIHVRLSGLAPNQRVRIRASTEDDENREWSSEALFRADARGVVDVTTQESGGGTYQGVSPMGLFWSMRLANESDGHRARATFTKNDSMSHAVRLEAEVDRSVIVCGRIERNFRARGTVTRDVAPDSSHAPDAAVDSEPGPLNGRVGRLFLPPSLHATSGGAPAVIVLSGGGGGLDLDKAAVLSRHGFATLALAYFGVPPRPKWLHRVPVEYVESAVTWLASQPEIDADRIGVLGVSRGAELALLAASRLNQLRAVVAYAPSSVAWDSGGRDQSSGEAIPAWTWRGEPMPSAPLPLRRFMWRSAFPVVAMRRPVMFRDLFHAGLRNAEAVERAAIPVEQVNGPMLLISGGDDHVWPAEEMAEAIVARLKKRRLGHRVEHLHYPGAGHSLRYPHLPTTARSNWHEHLRGARFSLGGSPEADAAAQADSWRRAIAFFKRHL